MMVATAFLRFPLIWMLMIGVSQGIAADGVNRLMGARVTERVWKD